MKGKYLLDSEDILDGSCEREYNAVMEWCNQDTRIGNVVGQMFKSQAFAKKKGQNWRKCLATAM